MKALLFVKLGGSLITEKHTPQTPRLDILQRLVREIATVRSENPEMPLILGHGSGSYGHMAARKHQTHKGVHTREEWQGFIEVWRQARALNNLVIEACLAAGLPVIAFPPSAMISSTAGQVTAWNITPLRRALTARLIPIVYGDVVFDRRLGGTILSTERLFLELAPRLRPRRILLCGQEEGVWVDYPQRQQLAQRITPEDFHHIMPALQGSSAPDVTGGMLEKVKSMLDLVQRIPHLEVLIFSGEQPDVLAKALRGETPGTIISAF